jgi:hypothetical protein
LRAFAEFSTLNKSPDRQRRADRKYTRYYADDGGEAHIEDVEVELIPGDFAPSAPPLYLPR